MYASLHARGANKESHSCTVYRFAYRESTRRDVTQMVKKGRVQNAQKLEMRVDRDEPAEIAKPDKPPKKLVPVRRRSRQSCTCQHVVSCACACTVCTPSRVYAMQLFSLGNEGGNVRANMYVCTYLRVYKFVCMYVYIYIYMKI